MGRQNSLWALQDRILQRWFMSAAFASNTPIAKFYLALSIPLPLNELVEEDLQLALLANVVQGADAVQDLLVVFDVFREIDAILSENFLARLYL